MLMFRVQYTKPHFKEEHQMICRQLDNLILSLYVQPNASQNKVVGLFNGHIKIQITAPANENKANKHLLKWLAKEFQVSLSQVTLEKGHQSRYKTVCVHHIQMDPAWITRLEKEK